MRLLALFIVGVVCLVLGAAVGSTVGAQEVNPVPVTPRLCYVPEYDLNGDGKVNVDDFRLWRNLVMGQDDDDCRIDGPASDCPPGLDINGDGLITHDDVMVMIEHEATCIRLPALTRVQP